VIEVSVPANGAHGQKGIKTYRRSSLAAQEITTRDNIPVTTVAATIIDLAGRLPEPELERMISPESAG
jgi:hypothetical protein